MTEIAEAGKAHGLMIEDPIPMPSNNFCVILRLKNTTPAG
jgi:hypothetical protein